MATITADRRSRARAPRRLRPVLRLGIAALTLLALFPVYWVVLSAFTPASELLSAPPNYLPSTLTFSNFERMAEQYPIGRALVVSVVLSVASSVAAVVLSYFAAYAFARYDFPLKKTLFVLLLMSSSVPAIATVIPLFRLYAKLELLGTMSGLILLFTSFLAPFTVWILTSFIRRVPVEIEEAARIDGAGTLRTILRITAPLTMPAITTMLIINFVISWHELFYPLIFAQSNPAIQPLSVGVVSMEALTAESGLPWDLISALTVVTLIPVVIVVVLFEPFITRGLAAGSDK